MFFIFQIEKENEQFFARTGILISCRSVLYLTCIIHVFNQHESYTGFRFIPHSLCLWNQSKLRSSCSSARFKFLLGRFAVHSSKGKVDLPPTSAQHRPWERLNLSTIQSVSSQVCFLFLCQVDTDWSHLRRANLCYKGLNKTDPKPVGYIHN